MICLFNLSSLYCSKCKISASPCRAKYSPQSYGLDWSITNKLPSVSVAKKHNSANPLPPVRHIAR